MRDLTEKFPNPPLREVAFEIRFTPDLVIPQEIYRYQGKIKHQLPKLGKTTAFSIGPQGLEIPAPEANWMFEDDEDNIRVTVRPHILGITSKKHKSFDDFLPQIRDLTTLFTEEFGIRALKRVGLRYINDIRLRDDPIADLKSWFVASFNPKQVKPDDIVQFSQDARQRRGEKFLTLRTQLYPDSQGAYHFILDIDSYFEGKLKVERLFKVVEELHEMTIREFHDNITDEFVDRLRRGKI